MPYMIKMRDSGAFVFKKRPVNDSQLVDVLWELNSGDEIVWQGYVMPLADRIAIALACASIAVSFALVALGLAMGW